MILHLYDTLTRTTRPIAPTAGDTYRFYCCGPTVYGPAHIGNFRTFLIQDLFRRVLEMTGTPTLHVRNLTDVDDKTIRQSQAEGRTLNDFTQHWTDHFHTDCAALNLLPPHIEPSAVAHIPGQITLIESLLEKGHAYRTDDGSVYFKIASFPNYGALSRLAERTITTNTVDREQSDEYDRESAADFALWKSRRPEDGENYWPSPFGEGRPGWHIECSAMAMKHLGETLDLHSGGVDLIFPHHENEIAQSEAATGKTFVHHWFHITHLLVDGRKMSKSLGNLYTLDELIARGHTAEELRYVLLSGTYRQPLNFTLDSLTAARKALARLRIFQQHLGTPPTTLPPISKIGIFAPVAQALCNDLNSPEALGQLFTIAKTLHAIPAGDPTLATHRTGLAIILHALGLTLAAPTETVIPTEIIALANQRLQARLSKNWPESDRLRTALNQAGWQIKDTPDSYQLTPL
jgi:cysteinyl-tRNA synthetase